MPRRPTTQLAYKNCWQAPGYRNPVFVLVDPKTGNEFELSLQPRDLQRVINECADAAKQIGGHPPIDWDQHPYPVYWPQITAWISGPPKPAKDQPLSRTVSA
jgi:hypothetical protein